MVDLLGVRSVLPKGYIIRRYIIWEGFNVDHPKKGGHIRQRGSVQRKRFPHGPIQDYALLSVARQHQAQGVDSVALQQEAMSRDQLEGRRWVGPDPLPLVEYLTYPRGGGPSGKKNQPLTFFFTKKVHFYTK